jgi:hypothetical protein
VLPSTGTYSIYVDPYQSATGSVTVTLREVPADPAPSLSLVQAGDSAAMTTTVPGQNMVPTFSGSAGDRVSVQFTGSTIGSVFAYIRKPDGSSLTSPLYGFTGSTGFIDTAVLPTTGTYSIYVDPYQAATGSVTATVYKVPADPAPGLSFVLAGDSEAMTVTTPGQNLAPTFSGSAGDRAYVSFTNASLGTAFAYIRKPDGSALTYQYGGFSGSSGYIDTVALPTTGTYTVFVDPYQAATGGVTVTVYKEGRRI